jgi:hypothetical protein
MFVRLSEIFEMFAEARHATLFLERRIFDGGFVFLLQVRTPRSHRIAMVSNKEL